MDLMIRMSRTASRKRIGTIFLISNFDHVLTVSGSLRFPWACFFVLFVIGTVLPQRQDDTMVVSTLKPVVDSASRSATRSTSLTVGLTSFTNQPCACVCSQVIGLYNLIDHCIQCRADNVLFACM